MAGQNPKKIVSTRTGKVTWRARLNIESMVNGKRTYPSKTFATQRQALAWLAEQRAAVNKGTYIQPSKLTLGEYGDEWIERNRHAVRTSSFYNYEGYWQRHIRPALGHRPLTAVTRAEVQRFIDTMAKTYRPATVTLAIGVIRLILKAAQRDNIILANPVDGTNKPRRQQHPVATWSELELHRFFQNAADHPSIPFWRLLITTGMRIGEALALTWADIDLEQRTIRINKTARTIRDGTKTIGPGAKTSTSNRLILLPPSMLPYLEQQATLNETARKGSSSWTDHDLVFPGPHGALRNQRSAGNVLRRLCGLSKVRPIRPHDLRHTYASLALSRGVAMKVVQEQLGHSSITMTMDLYSHVSEGMRREVLDTMEAIFAPASTTTSPDEHDRSTG